MLFVHAHVLLLQVAHAGADVSDLIKGGGFPPHCHVGKQGHHGKEQDRSG